MTPAVACYREFAPCEPLRRHVRAFFSFAPPIEADPARRPVTREVLFAGGESFCSPLFADGHTSMVFSLGRACRADGLWRPDAAEPNGLVIGAMTLVGPATLLERPEMVGVYFHAAQASDFTQVPACEFTDRIVDLDDLWGAAASGLAEELGGASTASARIDRLESALLKRIGGQRLSTAGLDVPGLAGWVRRLRGQLAVRRLADAAGVSRQHLTRVFRECAGVTPKLYCRLARFQAGLAYAGCGPHIDWAQAALDLGYADQSHMIAEFREFSSLTPQTLASRRWFHPFIERARQRRAALQSLAPGAVFRTSA